MLSFLVCIQLFCLSSASNINQFESTILSIIYHNQWYIWNNSNHSVFDHPENYWKPLSSFNSDSASSISLHILSFDDGKKDKNDAKIDRLFLQLIRLQNNYLLNVKSIIVSDSDSMIINQIKQLNIPIHFYPIHHQEILSNHRRLLSNTNTTTIINDTNELEISSLCQPWPIYVSFFCGIGVTVLITISIQFTMGNSDNELQNALEKVIPSLSYTSENDKAINIDPKHRRNSVITIRAPLRSHSRTTSRIIVESSSSNKEFSAKLVDDINQKRISKHFNKRKRMKIQTDGIDSNSELPTIFSSEVLSPEEKMMTTEIFSHIEHKQNETMPQMSAMMIDKSYSEQSLSSLGHQLGYKDKCGISIVHDNEGSSRISMVDEKDLNKLELEDISIDRKNYTDTNSVESNEKEKEEEEEEDEVP